jgi:cytochrome P450
MRANNELSFFLLDEIADRRANPGDDLLSTLVHATLTDDETADLEADTARQLSDEEIVSIVRQLLVAGNETTTNLLTQMMVRFSAEPDWWQRLRDEPALIDGAAEELLRLISPSGVNQRRTTRDVELGGVTIPAGADVLVIYLSADHDERVFPEPETFDPLRANVREHLAFGKGIHFCIGAALARLEIRIALHELTRAVESFELVDPDHLAWNRSFMLRAIKRLPIRAVLADHDPAHHAG